MKHPQHTTNPSARCPGAAGALLFSAVLLGTLGGCGGVPKVDYARPYPVELPPGPTVNVQVFRQSFTLEFTNTTPEPLGPGTIWLNRRFSKPIPKAIAVGQSVSIPLEDFRDEFGAPFKPGGFWAKEAPDTLVLCQFEVPREGKEAEIIGLVTVQSEAGE
ncbi:MAG: hypothetical protein U0573_00900 [Phycisphaerales bacterium]|nr:hypothetical protein [Planctomycetota bacterium]